MNKNYPYKKSKKRKYFKKWLSSVEGWRKWRVIPYASYIIAVIVCLGLFVDMLLRMDPPEITIDHYIIVSVACAFCGMIPFVIGVACSMKLKSKYGAPFSYMTRECLLVTEYGIEFSYVGKDWKWGELHNRTGYNIRFGDIEYMDIDKDSNICTIGGRRGWLTAYDDMTMQTHKPYNRVELAPNEPFRFIFAFNDQEEFVERVKGQVKDGVWGNKPEGLILNTIGQHVSLF